MATLPRNAIGVTCWCGHELMPTDSDHALACRTLTGSRTLRHDIVKDAWRRAARRAGMDTTVEPPLAPLRNGHPRPIAQMARRGAGADDQADGDRGDILIILPDAMTVVDVSVVHPAAPSYAPRAARVDGAGSAALRRERDKRRCYQVAATGAYDFEPLVSETFGRLGGAAKAFLGKLADLAADGSEDFERRLFVASAQRELGVALQRGNAVLCKAGLRVLTRVAGHAFRAGGPPTAEGEE